MQGLPRCISDHRYRAMLQEKEDAKKEAEAAKEERKRQREEAKKAKEEEKKKKKEEKERKQLEKAQATAMAAIGTMASTSTGGETRQGSGKRRKKRPVRFESSSESEDDSPVYDDSSSTDGEEEEEEDEDQRKWRYCAKCWKRFKGSDKETAIGCDTPYCNRWYHRQCVDKSVWKGKSEAQLKKQKWVCEWC